MDKLILDVLPLGKSYIQSTRDNSCGPLSILYVADIIINNRNSSRLPATEWIKAIRLLRGNNIWTDKLTSKKNIFKAIKSLGLTAKVIAGSNYIEKKNNITESIKRGNPVLVSCTIKPLRKSYAHYGVIVGTDASGIYMFDSYPKSNSDLGKCYKVYDEYFKSNNSIPSITVWGRSKWGIEIY
jgi:hypothetical protein